MNRDLVDRLNNAAAQTHMRAVEASKTDKPRADELTFRAFQLETMAASLEALEDIKAEVRR